MNILLLLYYILVLKQQLLTRAANSPNYYAKPKDPIYIATTILRPILGFSSLGTFGPDSKPRILINLVLPLASSTRLVATTIEDSSDYNISSNENKDRAKRTADKVELLDLDDFLGGF